MSKLNEQPINMNEAIERFLYIMENTNSRMVFGNYSIKKSLVEFSKNYGHIKLSDTTGLKTALETFFDTKGNWQKYNEKSLAMNTLYNWLFGKGLTKQDLARIYPPIQ